MYPIWSPLFGAHAEGCDPGQAFLILVTEAKAGKPNMKIAQDFLLLSLKLASH
jgi:hypothetical protein